MCIAMQSNLNLRAHPFFLPHTVTSSSYSINNPHAIYVAFQWFLLYSAKPSIVYSSCLASVAPICVSMIRVSMHPQNGMNGNALNTEHYTGDTYKFVKELTRYLIPIHNQLKGGVVGDKTILWGGSQHNWSSTSILLLPSFECFVQQQWVKVPSRILCSSPLPKEK